MDEKSTILIPSASEKQGYKYLLDRAWARRRKEEGHQEGPAQMHDPAQTAEIADEGESHLQPQNQSEQESLSAIQEEELELTPNEESAGEPELTPGLELDPDKNYYRIGEVAHLLGVEPHVLRYWENEFSHIRPTKSGGQRVYNRKMVESLQQIQHLLHKEGFSISGARKRIKEERHQKHAAPAKEEVVVPQKNLAELEKGLRELIRFAETTPAF